MPQILQLSQHVADLIAAGEVVERPASVVKELLENAVDAGATKVTLEIRDGGMTFLRVTDNGCGMSAQDAPIAFLRHATSKLRSADDLAAISTMGFRGEALAAIASVSRIDLMTKTADCLTGTGLHLDAGVISENEEIGCPDGTTIIIRDLFYNTPARMKFMKSDTVEAGRVAAAIQMQALAHPEVAFTYIRDGKQQLLTPGDGNLQSAVYCVYGRECANMVKVESKWDGYTLTGFVSKPTDARPSRNLQTFFVNDRPVRSKLLISALEEAYRNQIMVGKFPACVLHLHLSPNAVDVNVHPAKTEVKFLSERSVFDCIHYGVLSALNKQPDRPQVQFKQPPAPQPAAQVHKQENFFQAMTAQQYRAQAEAPKAPAPKAAPAPQTHAERLTPPPLRENVVLPNVAPSPVKNVSPAPARPLSPPIDPVASSAPAPVPTPAPVTAPAPAPEPIPEPAAEEIPWVYIGELYQSYVIVQQGEDAFLIDKHAAHERILFEKLKAHQEAISSQLLLTPIPVRLSAEIASTLLSEQEMLEELGFELEEFGDNTVLLRQIPMDLSPGDAASAVEELADTLLSGRREKSTTVRDELLHTVACKAAIKAGWVTDKQELMALVAQVMADPSLKYCPHGRPICITLSKKQLEKQFKRA